MKFHNLNIFYNVLFILTIIVFSLFCSSFLSFSISMRYFLVLRNTQTSMPWYRNFDLVLRIDVLLTKNQRHYDKFAGEIDGLTFFISNCITDVEWIIKSFFFCQVNSSYFYIISYYIWIWYWYVNTWNIASLISSNHNINDKGLKVVHTNLVVIKHTSIMCDVSIIKSNQEHAHARSHHAR